MHTFPYKLVTTRKAHVCDWCGESMSVGELAYAGRTVEDGDFWSSWMHPECNDAWEYSKLLDQFESGSNERGIAVDEYAPECD